MGPHASALVSGGIAALALLVALGLACGYAFSGPAPSRGRALALATLLLATWMGLTAVLAQRGLLAQFERRPPPLLLLTIVAIGGALALGLSRVGARMARGLPLWLLVGFHAFRLPLELVMHQAARRGLMPIQMSYEGNNYDIVSGVSALLIAAFAARGAPRGWLIAWDALAGVLLLNITVIAFASMPMVHAFGTAAPRLNTWVAYFPFVWLPTLLLASAYFGQVVLTRRLLTSRESGRRPVER